MPRSHRATKTSECRHDTGRIVPDHKTDPNTPATQKPRTIFANSNSSSITSGCFWGTSNIPTLGFATRGTSGGRQLPEEQPRAKNEGDVLTSRKPFHSGQHCRMPIEWDSLNVPAPLRKRAKKARPGIPEDLDGMMLSKASVSTTGDVSPGHRPWSIKPPHLTYDGSVCTSDEDEDGGERGSQKLHPLHADLPQPLFDATDHPPSPGSRETITNRSFFAMPDVEHKSRVGGMVRQQDGVSPGRRRGRSERSATSRGVDGMLAVYCGANPLLTAKTTGSGKTMPCPNDPEGRAHCSRRAGMTRKMARGKAVGSAAPGVAMRTVERGKQVELALEAAMESPLTYKERVRKERLAHLKMTYVVEKEIAALPMEFLRRGKYRIFGIKRRLGRMCAVLKISHRWTMATALARWTKAVKRARALKFAQDTLHHKQSRIFEKLVATKIQLELKLVRRRFFRWKRVVRLARLAEDQASSIDAANKIQRWFRRDLNQKRCFRATERRKRRRAAEALENANAIAGVLAFEDDRREVLRRTLRMVHDRRCIDTMKRASTRLQRAWLQYVQRCRILKFAEAEREKVRIRHFQDQASRWETISPIANTWVSAWLDVGRRAALTKIHAVHEDRCLVNKVEMAKYVRILTEAQSVLSRVSRGKSARMKAAARRKAVNNVQRAWRKAFQRWNLQEEIEARVKAKAVKIAALHEAAAGRLQHFNRRSLDRRRLFRRFDARRARLEFEARNRAELASAILILAPSRNSIREHSSPEDVEGVSAAACWSSTEDPSFSAKTFHVEDDDLDETKLGGQLARVMLREQEMQQRAAINMQRLWRWRKERTRMEERFREQRVKLVKEKQEQGARAFQRAWKCAMLKGEVAARVKTRRRVTAEREAGARRLQVFVRRMQNIKRLEARFAVRKIILELHAIAAEEAERRRKEVAAKAIQSMWHRRCIRANLSDRFKARKAKLTRQKEAEARACGALEIQRWWRRNQARSMLRGRFTKRAHLMAKIAEKEHRSRVENTVVRVLQHAWKRHHERTKMALRFKLRRKVLDETRALEESKRIELELLARQKLEGEKRMHREHETTKVKLVLVTAERDRKAEEAASHLVNGVFSDKAGGLDNQAIREREGDRTCKDCEDKVYCERCWTMSHKSEDMAEHCWKGAESGKDDLEPGEQHCVDCGFRKAKVVCLQCKDAFCRECNARIHSSGHRKNHQVESFVKAKRGWQTVEGRTENEPTFYFNATTNESTFDKPQELMVPEELFEHKRFLEYKSMNEKHVKKIEKLEFQLEEIMYEKDKIAFQWANAKREMEEMGNEAKKTSDAPLGKIKFGRTKKPAKDSSTKTQEQEEAYEKSLLLSRKEKKEMGFEVKLKK